MTRPTTSEQRERLLDAVAGEIAEWGFSELTVEGISSRAELSEAVFDEQFVGLEEAVEAAHEVFLERFRTRLITACNAQSGWALKVKVGIGVGLDFAAAAPAQMLLLSFDSVTTSPTIARRSTEARDQLTRFLAAGRTETEYGARLPALTEQMLIGGLLAIVSGQLVAGEAQRLPGLAPELAFLALLPYLGSEEAARVARRPKPRPEKS